MLPITQKFAEDQGPQIGVFEAAYELASMDTFTMGEARNEALLTLDNPKATKLSPEELNQKYTDVEMPFDKPMSEVAAFHLNEEGKKRRMLSEAINNGPGGTFYKQAMNLGASIWAHATDPVEFGVGAFAGFAVRGIGAVAKTGQLGTKLIKPGEVLAKGGYAAEAIEGVAGNLALEPVMYRNSKQAQIDYGIEDIFMNSVAGGLAAPTALFGVKKAFSMMSDSALGTAVKTSIGQFSEGKTPTALDFHSKAYDDYIYANPDEGAQLGSIRSQYKFEPLTDTADKTFYLAENKKIGSFFGDDKMSMTDNPNFANNLAAHPMDDVNADILEVKMSDVKLLDVDSKPSDLFKQSKDSISSVEFKTEKKNGRIVVSALSDGKEIGKSIFDDGGDYIYAAATMVDKEFRRKGIASKMYDLAEETAGKKAQMASTASDNAKAFWENRLKNKSIPDDLKDIINDSASIKDAYQKVSAQGPEAEKRFFDSLRSNGYDGLLEVDNQRGHNAVHLFPESASKLQEQAKFKPDVKSIAQPDSKKIEMARQASLAKETELTYDVQTQQEFDNFIAPDDMKSLDTTRMEAEIDEEIATLSSMAETGTISEGSKNVIEQVKLSKSKRKALLDVGKDFYNCAVSGMEL
jgi:ribosomal protein S18 acetylase RimI-like enzyme